MNNPTDRFRFRVWDNEAKEMHYGDGYSLAFNPNTNEVYLIDGCEMHYKLGDRFVIQQCTGQKDRNGKLIFEGDILEYAPGIEIIVQWYHSKDGLGHWTCEGIQYSRCLPWSDIAQSKIIGNIFELVNS